MEELMQELEPEIERMAKMELMMELMQEKSRLLARVKLINFQISKLETDVDFWDDSDTDRDCCAKLEE